MKKYNVLRNYKLFKREYAYFVVFIKCGDYYYTFDSDAKIVMYMYGVIRMEPSFRVDKTKFKEVLESLLRNGLNVVLAGSKLSKEYYSLKENKYLKIKKLSKEYYKATISSVQV